MSKEIYFVARADDAGSSHSANLAISKVINGGTIKNVSVMAPGNFVEEAAYMLASRKDICFGMHATINAEWDRVKWRPVSDLPAGSPLTDGNGMFLSNPRQFSATKPPVPLIIKEYDAQLDKLTCSGFNISYVDSHMFPEAYIEGLDEALCEWAKKKGLIDHMHYYAVPKGWEVILQDIKKLLPFLRSIESAQYFIVAHPALNDEEMRLTGNNGISGEKVAKDRSMETKLYSSRLTKKVLEMFGIRTLRYDEAKPFERATVEDILKILPRTQTVDNL